MGCAQAYSLDLIQYEFIYIYFYLNLFLYAFILLAHANNKISNKM